MSTYSDIIKQAQVILNDEGGSRYTADQLLVYVNAAVRQVRVLRPDLFLGRLAKPITNGALIDALPIPEEYVQVLVDYTAGMAELREDEFVDDGRAATLLGKFKSSLVGL